MPGDWVRSAALDPYQPSLSRDTLKKPVWDKAVSVRLSPLPLLDVTDGVCP
jgi:hypothetical protein